MRYGTASNWRRFGSFLMDSLILTVIITKPLSDILETKVPKTLTDFVNIDFQGLAVLILLISLINILYWVILEYKVQQTLGGLIFHIQAKSEKAKLTLNQVIIRNLTKASSILLLIDSISIIFSEKKQRFTEKWSKTLTVQDE